MVRHDEQLKLEVVKRYLAGDIGYRALAQEYGLARTLARQWVAEYELHGQQGLRRKGRSKYSAEFKLAALERMQRDNLSQAQVRAILGIRDPGAPSAAGNASIMRVVGLHYCPVPRDDPGRCRTLYRPNPSHRNPSRMSTREQLLRENEYLRAEVAYASG